MGMDVYGKKGDAYFRRSVWGWHPLWEYVEMRHGDIAKYVEHGHTNSGDGLDEGGSLELAQRLRHDLMDGTVDEYVSERNQYLASLPPLKCTLCDGTGQRPDGLYGVKWTKPGCNGCDGTGKRAPWETNYVLNADDIAEFAEFLEVCGGFAIC